MCFALVHKAEYKSQFEGRSIRAIQHEVPSLRDADTNVLVDLQRIHDTIPVAEWPFALYEVFAKYNVPWPLATKYPSTPQDNSHDQEDTGYLHKAG